MKCPTLETVVVLIKALCVITIACGTALSTSLAQYANTGEWPSRIVFWGVVIPSCMVAVGNSLWAFLSGSFTNYKDGRRTEPQTPATPPAPNP